MPCPRCQSLLVPEIFIDYESDCGSMSFFAYRCVACGDILDPTILRHRTDCRSPSCSNVRTRHPPVIASRQGDIGNVDRTEGMIT